MLPIPPSRSSMTPMVTCAHRGNYATSGPTKSNREGLATERGNLVMREFEGKGSSSLPPIKVPAIPEQTQEQKQQDAIAKTQRHLDFAVYQFEGIQRAHDPRD